MTPELRNSCRRESGEAADPSQRVCVLSDWERAELERYERQITVRFDMDIGGRLRRYTLDTWPSQAGRSAAMEPVRSWLEGDAGFWMGRNLVITGPAGEGKTGLAVGVARDLISSLALIDPHAQLRFFVVSDLLRDIRRSFKDAAAEDLEEIARTAELLVLDDLGSERPTPWARELLLRVVNYRDRHELPTIVTCNHSPRQLAADLGEPIVSRLVQDATRVHLDYGNLRLRRTA